MYAVPYTGLQTLQSEQLLLLKLLTADFIQRGEMDTRGLLLQQTMLAEVSNLTFNTIVFLYFIFDAVFVGVIHRFFYVNDGGKLC
jgi:hypothetical protein